jgi:hypothetical protein
VLGVYAFTLLALKLPEWLYHQGQILKLRTDGGGGPAAEGRKTPELSSGVTNSKMPVLIFPSGPESRLLSYAA